MISQSVKNMRLSCVAVGLMTAGTWAQLPFVKLWVTEVYEVNPDGSYTPKCGVNCPTQDLLPGIAEPGDLINIEATVEGWDTEPDAGKCVPGGEVCGVAAQNCTRSHCTGTQANRQCADDSDCTFPNTCDPDKCEKSPRMGAFGWTIDSSTYSNGGPGPGLAPAELACTTDADCVCAYREIPGDFNDCKDLADLNPAFCTCSPSVCDGGFCGFASAAYIDSSPLTNYLYFSHEHFSGITFATLNFGFGATSTEGGVFEDQFQCSAGARPLCNADADCPEGTCELVATSPYYLGTLLLEATDDACGMFTVDLDHDADKTFFRDALAFPMLGPVIEALTLDFGGAVPCDDNDPCTENDAFCGVGECAGTPIVCQLGQTCENGNCVSPCGFNILTGAYWADDDPPAEDPSDRPGNCAIDAREPHSINDAGATNGWDRLVLQFDCDPTALAASIGPGDFTRLTDPFGLAPFISGITADAVENTITLQLNRQISPNFYTCITHTASGKSWCAGYLPADASQDGLSASNDINALIDSINLVPGRILPIHASDINRSNVITGADILRLIDLLNGASAFDRWITQRLPDDCPSAP